MTIKKNLTDNQSCLMIRVAGISTLLPDKLGFSTNEEKLQNGCSLLDNIYHESVGLGNKFQHTDWSDERIPNQVQNILSFSSKIAIIAGLNALEKKGLIHKNSGWVLSKEEQYGTGIIFASSFDHHDRIVKSAIESNKNEEVERLVQSLENNLEKREDKVLTEEHDKKTALKIILSANVQLAQIIKAKGPNMFTSNSCASTTAALKLACNYLKLDDAKRMIVISADTPLQENSKAIVNSFVKMKAASSSSDFSKTVLPFSKGRDGFVFGEGAIAIILERHDSTTLYDNPKVDIELITSHLANSAYHGTRINEEHLTHILDKCVRETCQLKNITLEEMASECIYVAHETFTSICSSIEIKCLDNVFGRENLRKIHITCTKNITGHVMGVCIEDAMSILCLETQTLPDMTIPDLDPDFQDLCFKGGRHNFKYAIHVALGMGSHVACVIYGRANA
jgi:3-oxoacyl-(acyl-carrier-protein) synthase